MLIAEEQESNNKTTEDSEDSKKLTIDPIGLNLWGLFYFRGILAILWKLRRK